MSRARLRRPRILLCVAAALMLGGCAAPGVPGRTDTLTVYAAASLGTAFDTLATLMEKQNRTLDVVTVYDGSSTLATQITEGAPADVFASADQRTMDPLVVRNLIDKPTLFAANTLLIAVAPGNPLQIASLADLARLDVVTVLCAPEVPCGAASVTLLGGEGVLLSPASEEQSVTAVVTKVAEGLADAGLVYATDVAANPGRIEGVTPGGADKVVARYSIGVVVGGAHSAAARAFVDLVLSPEGQSILAHNGFLAP